MRNLLLFILFPCLLLNQHAAGQAARYPVSAIDTALLKNASVVVRCSDMNIHVSSLNSEYLTHHLVFTILKGSAADEAILSVAYNNWSDIDRFEGVMYDARGAVIKKLGKKDIFDQSAISDGMLYSDERMKTIRPVIGGYPVTIEYFVKQSFRRMLAYPTWKPQYSFNMAVESAKLTLEADGDLMPRFKALRIPENAVISGDGTKTKTWEIAGLAAVTDEPFSPPLTELAPVIYIEPNTYSVKGYTGDFSSWKSFGGWIATLQESRDSLSATVHARMNELVSGTDNLTEKVKRVYRYMQSTCRYVSVDVGIGGIQSEMADKVARLGYGDCKGLVNYTVALLKAAGIPSYYTLVRSGDNAEAIQRDFPGNQFDHVILCVPTAKDSIWLECTGMKMPFGYLGNFTDDRDVLAMTPQGGLLLHTPVYPKEQNTSSRFTRMTVDSTGEATVQMRSIYRGLQFDPVMEQPYRSADEQKEALRKHFRVPGVLFSSVSYKAYGDRLPVMEEQAKAVVPKFSSVSGNRMFIFLNRFLDNPGTFARDNQRKYDVVVNDPYIDYDTVVVEIPRGCRIETSPAPAELKTRFGMLNSEVKTDGKTVTMYRRFELEKGRYPAGEYNSFIDFLRQVARQDNSGVVVIR